MPLDDLELMDDELMFIMGGGNGEGSGAGCGCGCKCDEGSGCGCGSGSGSGCGCGCNSSGDIRRCSHVTEPFTNVRAGTSLKNTATARF